MGRERENYVTEEVGELVLLDEGQSALMSTS